MNEMKQRQKPMMMVLLSFCRATLLSNAWWL